MIDFEKYRKYCLEKKIPLIREESAKILFDTAKKAQPKTILEIGTGYGFSACVMATACYGKIFTIDTDEDRQETAKEIVCENGFGNRVEFICDDALEVVTKSLGKYDFIFLDGAKSQYLDLLPYLLALLNLGGALVCDNVNYLGLTAIADSLPNNHKHITIARKMAEFVKRIKENPALKTTLYNIEDGISVSYLVGKI